MSATVLATPTLVQVCSTVIAGGANSPRTVTFSKPCTAGNTIICIGDNFNRFASNRATDSAGNVYNQVFAYGGAIEMFVAQNIVAGTNTVSCFSDGGEVLAVVVLEYSGLAGFDVGACNYGTPDEGVYLPTGTVTPTVAGDLVLVLGDGPGLYTDAPTPTLENQGGGTLIGPFPSNTGEVALWQRSAATTMPVNDAVAFLGSLAAPITAGIFCFKASVAPSLAQICSEWSGAPIGTVSGSAIFQMPPCPFAAQSLEFTATDIVATSVSPFSAQQQSQDWQQGFLEVSISMPPLTQIQAQQWIAFLMSLRGQLNVFLWGDPLAIAPAGTAQGSPVVASGSQLFTLATSGWLANTFGLLLPGDWIQVGMRLYRTVQVVNSDASGAALIAIWPPLREAPVLGAPLILKNAQGLFRLKNNARKWSETEARYYGMQFEIREALFSSSISSSVLVSQS